VSDVKSVTVDFWEEMARPLSFAHAATRSAWAERVLAAVGMSGEVYESVKSSA